MITADLTTIALIVIAISSLLFSTLLADRGKQKGNDFEFDNTIATFATRNAPLPYLIGIRRVGVSVVSVWGRTTREESVGSIEGGKGGGGGGSGNIKQTVYFENAIHYICLAPGAILRAIYENGEKIWEGYAMADTDFQYQEDLGDPGAFTFRSGVGDVNRPYHRDLNGIPLFSNLNKFIVSVEWTNKRLGGSPDWAQLEYLVENFDSTNAIPGSAYLIKPAGGDDEQDKGVNAAHALWQILTAPWPFGVGLDNTEVDGQTMEELGYICEVEGLAVNLLIKGDEASSVIADILNIVGAFMSDTNGRLVFRPIRPADPSLPTLSLGTIIMTEDIISPPRTEVTISTGISAPTRVILNFPDRQLNFRANQPISMDNDGSASRVGSYRSKTQNTDVITSRLVGDLVGARKLNEVYGDSQGFKVFASRASYLVVPGDELSLPDIGQVRAVSVEHGDILEQEVYIECLRDSYGVISDGEGSDTIVGSVSSPGVQADRYHDWVEVPDEESNGNILIVVFRIRTHSQISSAKVWVQVDSGEYVQSGQQNSPASGGTIRTGILADIGEIIESGPIVDSFNEDISNIVDLSGDTSAWYAGRQLCKINDEVFFLRNITLVSESSVSRSTAYSLGDYVIPPSGQATGLRYKCVQAGTTASTNVVYWPEYTWQENFIDGTVEWEPVGFAFQLKGMIRARYDTTEEAHALGSVVAIIEKNQLSPFSNVAFGPGVQVCMKTQPSTASATLDLSVVTAICDELLGAGLGDLYADGDGDYYCISPTNEYFGVTE